MHVTRMGLWKKGMPTQAVVFSVGQNSLESIQCIQCKENLNDLRSNAFVISNLYSATSVEIHQRCSFQPDNAKPRSKQRVLKDLWKNGKERQHS